MREFAPTLWHLLGLARRDPPADRRGWRSKRPSMQSRYDALVDEMKETYGVRVHRWRTSSTGCAWVVRYEDGRVSRLIEAPYPRGPISCAVFLHEIGHHAIGWDRSRLRCIEEYEAWRWALDTMRARRLNVTAAVERRVAESMRWAVTKAKRRGLKMVPADLMPYA